MQFEPMTNAHVNTSFKRQIEHYSRKLFNTMKNFNWTPVCTLASELLDCWKNRRQVFICGNGGSGANAIHMANDFIYGISKSFGSGIKCHALTSNTSITTCLANDVGYDNIFSYQLGVLANAKDVLLVLSGSGNSKNIIQAVETAKKKNMNTYGIFGYSGGEAKTLVETPIHFSIDDMQVSEDLQMIIAHMISQWLYEHRYKIL